LCHKFNRHTIGQIHCAASDLGDSDTSVLVDVSMKRGPFREIIEGSHAPPPHTDTLRATLRDLAEADARLYRGLAEELATPATRPALPDGDIAAAIALLERHGYTVTPPEG
jgi:hypothetical protein